MHIYLHKLEKFVDKIIPYTLIILLFIIIGELFFRHYIEPYQLYIKITDYTIVFIFLIDLSFKYKRSTSIPNFLRTSWLDIIAVFPFFLVFRLVEEMVSVAKTGEMFQLIFHETVEVEKVAPEFIKEESRIIKEFSGDSKLIREARASRIATRVIRPLSRIPRFAKALKFYEKPTMPTCNIKFGLKNQKKTVKSKKKKR